MAEQTLTLADIAKRLKDRTEDFSRQVIGQDPVSTSPGELRFMSRGGFAIYLKGAKRGKWRDFRDDLFGDMLDLPEHILGLSKQEAIEYAKNYLDIADSDDQATPQFDADAARKESEEAEKKKLRTARFLWNSSKNAQGTVAVDYLVNERGIPLETIPASIRHRHLDAVALEKMGIDAAEHDATDLDAVVFAATDNGGNVTAVQQIVLKNGKPIYVTDKDGNRGKVKRTNGSLIGSAVRFGEVKDALQVAEGPETGLSAWIGNGVPTWVTLGTSNYTNIIVPPHVKRIVFLADVEPSGTGIARAIWAAEFWRAKGFETAVSYTPVGDFNDLLRQQGADVVKAVIANVKVPDVLPPSGETVVVTQHPWDAYAIWRSTGYMVRATMKPMKANHQYHVEASLGETARRGILVLNPGELPPKTWKTNTQISFVQTGRLTMRDIFKTQGPAGVRNILNNATPMGKDALFGLDDLIEKPKAQVILVQSRRAADAALRLLPDCAVVAAKAAGDGALDTDFSPLSGRRIVIAPTHCPRGHQEAAVAATLATDAGASEVRILEWPLYVADDAGYRILHRRIPANYDFAAMIEDGWDTNQAAHILGLTHEVFDARALAA